MNVSLTWILAIFLLFSLQAHPLPYKKPEIQHSKHYHKQSINPLDINQYYISEKLDGMRGYWNGEKLVTRQGNIINSPKWFTKGWPNIPIDGELWISRNNFQSLMSCVRRKTAGECWKVVRFMIFDLPTYQAPFSERVTQMQMIVTQVNSPYLKSIKQSKINTLIELDAKLEEVISNKGEGLMLHLASAYYHIGRSNHLLKLKKHQDAETVIIEHIKGKGKYQHKLGAVKVKTAEGIIFKIGSGFTDDEREAPPPIGTIITYKYNGLTQSGKPRFARFWRVRSDNLIN